MPWTYDQQGNRVNPDGTPYVAERDSQLAEAKMGRAWKKAKNWLFGGTKGDEAKARASADQLGAFADQAQQSYGQTSTAMDASQAMLADRAAGNNLVSPMMLRSALGQLYGQQASAVASAAPRNQPMLARQAMIESGMAGMAAANQGAIAGAQEQAAAQQAYAQMLAQRRAIDAQTLLAARGQAQQNFAANAERDRGVIGKYGGMIAAGAAMFSDERLKENVRGESDDSGIAAALAAVGSYSYDYRDQRNGRGRQRGIMAQDLERAGLGHAVIDTPQGKVVHGAKLAAAAAAGVGELARRLERLERKGARRG